MAELTAAPAVALGTLTGNPVLAGYGAAAVPAALGAEATAYGYGQLGKLL